MKSDEKPTGDGSLADEVEGFLKKYVELGFHNSFSGNVVENLQIIQLAETDSRNAALLLLHKSIEENKMLCTARRTSRKNHPDRIRHSSESRTPYVDSHLKTRQPNISRDKEPDNKIGPTHHKVRNAPAQQRTLRPLPERIPVPERHSHKRTLPPRNPHIRTVASACERRNTIHKNLLEINLAKRSVDATLWKYEREKILTRFPKFLSKPIQILLDKKSRLIEVKYSIKNAVTGLKIKIDNTVNLPRDFVIEKIDLTKEFLVNKVDAFKNALGLNAHNNYIAPEESLAGPRASEQTRLPRISDSINDGPLIQKPLLAPSNPASNRTLPALERYVAPALSRTQLN